jgi:hypothetical protein
MGLAGGFTPGVRPGDEFYMKMVEHRIKMPSGVTEI